MADPARTPRKVQAKKLLPADRPRLDLAARIVHRCAVTFLRVTSDPGACVALGVEGRAAIAALAALLDCIDGMAVAASSPVERVSAAERLRPVSAEDDPVLAAMGGGAFETRARESSSTRRLPDVSARHSTAAAVPFARRKLGDSVTLRDLLTSSSVAVALSLSQMSGCKAPGNLLGMEGLPLLAVRLLSLSEGRVSIAPFPALVPRQLRYDMVSGG